VRPLRIMVSFLSLFNAASSVSYANHAMPTPLEDGIIFFNAGRYFEAHEAWEDMWRAAGGPLRLFYQGLVQAAVGLHHLSQGNQNGAAAQLRKSLSKLDQYPDRFCDINNRRLVDDLRRVLDRMTSEPVQIERA
jgi:predicted metal-dependent hydrolase